MTIDWSKPIEGFQPTSDPRVDLTREAKVVANIAANSNPAFPGQHYVVVFKDRNGGGWGHDMSLRKYDGSSLNKYAGNWYIRNKPVEEVRYMKAARSQFGGTYIAAHAGHNLKLTFEGDKLTKAEVL